jgi:putative glutamine amidotransferase
VKKYFSFFIILFLITELFMQCNVEEKPIQEKTRLVVVNPGVWYLKSFAYLVENKIIDIPNLELLAVYHSKANKEYNDCQEFIRNKRIPFIKPQIVNGELHKADLFQMNSCTDNFYEIFKSSSGILFLGGADIPPAVYGQKTNLLTGISTPHRHFFELSFLHHLVGGREDSTLTPFLEENPDYVVYGFCLGMQTMNVAAGGSMHQDIPSDIYGLRYVENVLQLDKNLMHKNYWTSIDMDEQLHWRNFHKIRILDDNYFDKFNKPNAGLQPMVCSIHHQAVKDLPGDYQAAAASLDGKVIEAVSHKKYKNVFGVQFHPEFFTLYDPQGPKYKYSPDDSVLVSENEVLSKDKSLLFHQRYWAYFSGLFK